MPRIAHDEFDSEEEFIKEKKRKEEFIKFLIEKRKIRKASGPPVKKVKKIKSDNDSSDEFLSPYESPDDYVTSSDEDDYEEEPETDCEKIKRILLDTESYGKYSVEGEAPELPVDSGLWIKGFGNVSTPINKLQAEELIKVCEQAPFGLENDTVYDKTVRDTYQLHPSSIEIRNPDWNGKLVQIVDRISCELLGSNAKVEAKLYKLLLYKKGGHFKRHKDTEKEKSMFATLVVQLPSKYSGGELIVYNGTSSVVCDFGQKTNKSTSSIHYAAHYADLDHELLKVKSGYRLVLVYSLCWADGGNDQTKSFNNMTVLNELKHALENIETNKKPFALTLDHEYTEQSFSSNGIRALKGIDNDRFRLINSANDMIVPENQYNFYIVYANLTVSRLNLDLGFRSDCTEYHGSKKLKDWYDRTGYSFFKYLKLEFDIFSNIINLSCDEDGLDDKLDTNHREVWGRNITIKKTPYTGNEMPSKTTIYHKYMLVLFPKKHEYDFILKTDFHDGVRLLVNSLRINADVYDISNADKILTFFSNDKKSYWNREVLLSIIYLISKYPKYIKDAHVLVNKFLSQILETFNQNICTLLTELVNIHGWNVIRDNLPPILYPIKQSNSNQIPCMVKKLFKLDSNKAYECLNDCVLKNIDIQKDDYFKLFTYQNYFDLIENLLLFKDKQLEEYVELVRNRFKKIYLVTLNKKLGKNSSTEAIQDEKRMFKDRKRYLKVKLNDPPCLDWRMDACIPEFKELEDFLRSDLQQTTLHGFNSLIEARKIKEKHQGLKKNYSVKITEKGIGKKAHIIVEKTKALFDKQTEKFNEYKSELNIIKNLFLASEKNNLEIDKSYLKLPLINNFHLNFNFFLWR